MLSYTTAQTLYNKMARLMYLDKILSYTTAQTLYNKMVRQQNVVIYNCAGALQQDGQAYLDKILSYTTAQALYNKMVRLI
jgi:hypothetical protein